MPRLIAPMIAQTDRKIKKNLWRVWTVETHCGVDDFPIPVSFHLTLLRETGFRKIHVFWQSCLQAGICAVKQA